MSTHLGPGRWRLGRGLSFGGGCNNGAGQAETRAILNGACWRFSGRVAASRPLALLLSVLGRRRAACLGLVVRQALQLWAGRRLLLTVLGPLAGWVRAAEALDKSKVELRLIQTDARPRQHPAAARPRG